MILIQLNEAMRDELKSLRRQQSPPRVRDRLEMVLLSSVAWSPARIAAHLGYCAPTVRGLLKDFLARGTAALFPRRTGPPPDFQRRQQVTQTLTGLLSQDRTWTSRQLATALAEQDITLRRDRFAATSRCWGPAGGGPPTRCVTSRTRSGSPGPRACWAT